MSKNLTLDFLGWSWLWWSWIMIDHAAWGVTWNIRTTRIVQWEEKTHTLSVPESGTSHRTKIKRRLSPNRLNVIIDGWKVKIDTISNIFWLKIIFRKKKKYLFEIFFLILVENLEYIVFSTFLFCLIEVEKMSCFATMREADKYI